MLCRTTNDQLQFSLTDTADSPWAESTLAEARLSRAQVLADPEYREFMHIAEHIVTSDSRVERFLYGH
jgi:hypothetical protein